MNLPADTNLFRLLAGVLGLLVLASAIGWTLSRHVSERNRATVDNINARIRAWWVMSVVFMVSPAGSRTAGVAHGGSGTPFGPTTD